MAQNEQWAAAFTEAADASAESSNFASPHWALKGVLAVLGGMPLAPQVGGFALLTNSPQQAAAGGKPKTIGFGTEHVAAGLECEKLPAGIISKVSESAGGGGNREVVVANRQGMDCDQVRVGGGEGESTKRRRRFDDDI